MLEDIFVPKSSPENALVGPLHTVTYITADKPGVETALVQGYGLKGSAWLRPSAAEFDIWNPYLGFDPAHTWEVCNFSKVGPGNNVQIRVIHIDQITPSVRPNYEGLYKGGATISFPIADLRKHEERMAQMGIESTMGVKEMEFTSPAGETYVSAEIVYKAPDNVFLLGVTRPDIFIPVGPVDPAFGIGGPAYSARCVTGTDSVCAFLQDVLGFEIRRDVNFEVDNESAINLPAGTVERFVQAFAPGSRTAYLVLMDHGEETKYGETECLGPPNRGIGIWSFPAKDIDEVHRRALKFGVEIMQPPTAVSSPLLNTKRTMLMQDPDGFPIEVFAA